MLIKLIAFIAAAIPVFLFVRATFYQRSPRMREGMRELKKQVDFAVTIFIVLVGGVMAIALIKIAWTWWASR
jgi:hypothetical protein